MSNNSYNDSIMLGAGILLIGIMLSVYSVSTYFEVKKLGERIDFESIDNNLKMTASDKYYEYLKISDYLNKKLKKNKNIPIKNTACVYLDYAQHNAIEIYRLTERKQELDETKKNAAAGIVRSLSKMTDNYKTCKNSALYKQELEKILKDIENADKNKIDTEQRMNEFLDGYRERKQAGYYNEQDSENYEYNEQIPQPDYQEEYPDNQTENNQVYETVD